MGLLNERAARAKLPPAHPRRADAAIKHPIHSLSGGGADHMPKSAPPRRLYWIGFSSDVVCIDSIAARSLSPRNPGSLFVYLCRRCVHLDSNGIRTYSCWKKVPPLWSSFSSTCDWSIVISHWFWGLAHTARAAQPISNVCRGLIHTARSFHWRRDAAFLCGVRVTSVFCLCARSLVLLYLHLLMFAPIQFWYQQCALMRVCDPPRVRILVLWKSFKYLEWLEIKPKYS